MRLRRTIKHLKKVKKSRKGSKSRKVGKSRTVGKSRKVRKHHKLGHKRKTHKGGYGPGGCPVGKSWSADGTTNSGYYYGLSPTGIDVGGVDPFFGNQSPSPQRPYQAGGGTFTSLFSGSNLMPTTILNSYRVASNNLANYLRQYHGQSSLASPLPFKQSPNRKIR